MTQYIARRVISLIPVLLGVSIIVFSLIRMIDPVTVMLESERLEDIRRVLEEMGFNRPIHEQYIEWMGRILLDDLGTSIINARRLWTNSEPLGLQLNWWWLL